MEMDAEDIPIDSDLYYSILDALGEKYICRLLGAPTYMKFPINRECPVCKKEMQYIATIGSQSYDAENA
ncbi:hypothetical protein [Inediibacterium massiliense]|uniref:hypothetical protein n=1 Tax=Inediibacterium massiliense TaxID=1658111 RepID=UPI0006B41050|nr:hypothetical protein [Inediibacterium massiliense]